MGLSGFLTEQDIVQRLAEARLGEGGAAVPDSPYPAELLPNQPRPAAVLVPLLHHSRGWHVLYTRRTASLQEHSGQVAFPGGRSDAVDPDPETTALREAQEEIGLDPRHVRILGRLNDFLTITNYLVTPVVGIIPWPYPLRPASVEVARVFTIPLDWLADPENHEVRQRLLPPPYGSVPVIYFKPYEDELLWGASARFTLTLLDNLGLLKKEQDHRI